MSEVKLVRVEQPTYEAVEFVKNMLKQLSDKEYDFSLHELAELCKNSSTLLYFAQVEGQNIGMITLNVSHKPTGKTIMVDDVVVDNAHRGKGYAKEIILVVLQIAKDINAKNIFLTSNRKRIAANKLYLSCGFETKETNVYIYNL